MENLHLIPEQEMHHYLRCETCNEYFDCRDLSQVFDHLYEKVAHPKFTSSKKNGEVIEYMNGKIEMVQN